MKGSAYNEGQRSARRCDMNISDYRREYQACCAAPEHARYKYHAGLESQLHLQPIHDRYAELHTPKAVNDLQRAWDQTPAHAETERASLRALLSAARLAYGEAHAAAATEELKRCEEAAHIDWDGGSVAARDVLTRIANEPEAVRRRDLAARWADALGRCNDLRAARLQSLRDSAQTLGLPHARALYEEATNTDHARLAAAAADFLERTAPAYTSHLSQWTARHLPAELQSNLAHADYLFLKRAAHLDTFFPGRELLATYTAAMNNLGISVDKQANVHVNDAPPGSELKLTHCYAIHPPDDVRLLIVAANSAEQFVTLLREAGRAQYFGWISPDLAARYPEFVYAPDEATQAGFACLFASLFHDLTWAGEHLGLGEREAGRIARTLALIEAHDVRRCAALLRVELDLDNSQSMAFDKQDNLYAAQLHEATGFRSPSAMYLLDVGDDFSAGVCLRARLFAAKLGEHLRTRHGRKWWATGRARDELIDMWNTGGRYSVEELARLVCGGPLDFDLLAETIKESLDGK